ncbi:MAG: Mbeg1-like protein, partial [Lachnospiraceae bacterium]
MLTDVELMLLEHLEYLDSSVEYVAGVTLEDWKNRTIGEILAAFDEEACRWLSEKGDELIGPLISGREWAAILTGIRENRHLSSLVCIGRDENVFATAYRAPEGNAFVTFRGTTGGHEWYDDVDGLHGADTVCQEESLNYIESLPFDKITVAGHSKGGNKAQYVAVVSDKVERCVSMDGQGFSREFIDKYAERIRTRAGRIRNYSLANDYVHILLYPVPGAEQIYCKGGPLHVGYLAHSPAGFFRYEHVMIQDRALKEETLEDLSDLDLIEEPYDEGKQSGIDVIGEASEGIKLSEEGKQSD